jgi:hypothetical protein
MHAARRRQRLMAPCSIMLIGCWQMVCSFSRTLSPKASSSGEQVLGQIRKAEEVVLGNNQRVPKDKVAQSRFGVEILGFVNDLVFWIGRVRYLWYGTKQTIHPEPPPRPRKLRHYMPHLPDLDMAKTLFLSALQLSEVVGKRSGCSKSMIMRARALSSLPGSTNLAAVWMRLMTSYFPAKPAPGSSANPNSTASQSVTHYIHSEGAELHLNCIRHCIAADNIARSGQLDRQAVRCV